MATVEQTLLKVQRILTGPLGLRVELVRDMFLIRFEELSTYARIFVHDWGTTSEGESRTLVIVNCPLIYDIRPSPPLHEWIAQSNGTMWFGRVEMHESETAGMINLFLAHTLLGDYLDEAELETALFALLSRADALDDELRQRFGGRRALDS